MPNIHYVDEVRIIMVTTIIPTRQKLSSLLIDKNTQLNKSIAECQNILSKTN